MDLKDGLVSMICVIAFVFTCIIIANLIDIRLEMMKVRVILEEVQDEPAYQIQLNNNDYTPPNEAQRA